MNDSELLLKILTKILKEEVTMNEFVAEIIVDYSQEEVSAVMRYTVVDGLSFEIGQVREVQVPYTEENVMECQELLQTIRVQHFAKLAAEKTA